MTDAFDGIEQSTKQPVRPSLVRKFTGALYQGWSYFSFSYMAGFLDKGDAGELDVMSAVPFHPEGVDAGDLQKRFESIYHTQKVKSAILSIGVIISQKGTNTMHLVKSLLKLERKNIIIKIVMAILEQALRLSGPFALRYFLIWLENYKDDKAEYWEGWIWGALLAVIPFLYAINHHRLFWIAGMVGYSMRTALLAAVHGKLFRLNTSSMARVTTGYVVNVASNDLKRFDNAALFWPFLIIGPFDGFFVLIMISLYLGFLPALAGVGCILIIIPIQSLLSKYIGRCRMRTARAADRRINMTGELITGNLAVKMLGWEDPLLNDVTRIRKKEQRLLALMGYVRGGNVSLPGITQGLVAAATFITYRFTNGEFNVPDVFFALSLMTLPRLSLAYIFVLAIECVSSTWVACERVNAFLSVPEPRPIHVSGSSETTGSIGMTTANFGWYIPPAETKLVSQHKRGFRQALVELSKMETRREDPTLRQALSGITLSVKPGELIGIAGPVGSGKSSLLAAMLNDMEELAARENVRLSGSVSFCSQIPWIVSGSIRENILFGRPFNEALYNEVIESCALETDFEQFPGGDSTELGERGINISGGQKARIALARAAFSQADIHLLDDPLSAVDPRVGRILFERCIGPQGIMKNSTRLLVTHQRQFLPNCDRIILMDEGCIEAVGTWEELSDHEILKVTERIGERSLVSIDSTRGEGSIKEEVKNTPLSPESVGSSSLARDDANIPPEKEDNSATLHLTDSRMEPCIEDGGQLIVDEEKQAGTISLKVFREYIIYVGLLPMMLALSLMFTSRACFFSGEWWLGAWASTDDDDQDDLKWIWVLVALTVAGVVTSIISSFSMFSLLILGSSRLHKEMLRCVLRAPLKFFHTNPTGRILNRFSKDLGLQDDELPLIIVDLMTNALVVMGAYVLVSIALPYMLIFFAVLTWIFWRIRRRYATTSVEVKRFDGITRSPVFAMLSTNIKGLTTIRAYESESAFQGRFLKELELNGSWWTAFLTTTRWLGFRMDIIGAAVLFFSVVMAILLADEVSSDVLGLALTNVLALAGILQWTVRQTAEFENGMTSVERNMEYTKLEQEHPREAEGGGSAPEGWPSKGAIEYASVTASYRPGLDPVLEDLSFIIPGGSSVGIVGRTGSGKSSLLLTLFRLIDINEGQIKIDDVDVSKIGIDVLRKELAVIPQDPVLFGGTLRSNLDPLDRHSDAKIWDVLKTVALEGAAGAAGGLNAKIADCGSNLSVGQRQLLCLARALLSDAKILALDEATANVDRTTDAFIQKSLHSLIIQNSKTLLIIAHRIDTVMDCEWLLVLDAGHIVEFGSPEELRSKKGGTFAGMVAAAKKAMKGSFKQR